MPDLPLCAGPLCGRYAARLGNAGMVQSRSVRRMPPKLTIVPRQKYNNKKIDMPKDESGYFIRCPACGGRIDVRDVRKVLEHDGPLPHPSGYLRTRLLGW
jgi:hypothetical protein